MLPVGVRKSYCPLAKALGQYHLPAALRVVLVLLKFGQCIDVNTCYCFDQITSSTFSLSMHRHQHVDQNTATRAHPGWQQIWSYPRVHLQIIVSEVMLPILTLASCYWQWSLIGSPRLIQSAKITLTSIGNLKVGALDITWNQCLWPWIWL